MRIAIVTCEQKPDGTTDDLILLEALEARGHQPSNIVWSEEKTDWSTYDVALLRSPWDYYKKLPAFLSWAEKTSRKTTLLNPLSTLLGNCDKDYLLELEKQGLPIVPSYIFSNQEQAVAKARELLRSAPLVAKPTVSGGSYLTYAVKSETELEPALSRILKHGKVLLQPFLTTVATEGEVSLIYFRVGQKWEFSHALVKTAAQGEFRVQADFGGREKLYEPSTQVKNLAEKILQTLSPRDLYVRIDLLDWRTEPKIGEIELIEPALFFGLSPTAAPLLVKALEAI